jgi:hypothetical protein
MDMIFTQSTGSTNRDLVRAISSVFDTILTEQGHNSTMNNIASIGFNNISNNNPIYSTLFGNGSVVNNVDKYIKLLKPVVKHDQTLIVFRLLISSGSSDVINHLTQMNINQVLDEDLVNILNYLYCHEDLHKEGEFIFEKFVKKVIENHWVTEGSLKSLSDSLLSYLYCRNPKELSWGLKNLAPNETLILDLNYLETKIDISQYLTNNLQSKLRTLPYRLTTKNITKLSESLLDKLLSTSVGNIEIQSFPESFEKNESVRSELIVSDYFTFDRSSLDCLSLNEFTLPQIINSPTASIQSKKAIIDYIVEKNPCSAHIFCLCLKSFVLSENIKKQNDKNYIMSADSRKAILVYLHYCHEVICVKLVEDILNLCDISSEDVINYCLNTFGTKLSNHTLAKYYDGKNLPEDLVKKIEKIVNVEVSRMEDCCICSQRLCDTLSLLPCNHIFHERCLKENEAHKISSGLVPVCPMCKCEYKKNN